MPPSQLKRLKASLREQGITGPQKSKKQKKTANKSEESRAQKHSALASIRESFNPFEFKHLARPKKFEYVSNNAAENKRVLGRPGVTKSQGEETRRKSLLPEMNRKNRVGGILDRRIGENDPTMSLDDRMMARFEREQLKKRPGNVFDLEDDEADVQLTHGGQSLTFDHEIGEEDYDAASISGSSDGEDGFMKRKRRRDDVDGVVDDEAAPETDEPERKKSKAEVMKEVMAKSKLHKYERQAQKEDDDDLREELDKDLNDVLAALRGHMTNKPEPSKAVPKGDFTMNSDRAALLAGTSQAAKDKEYDTRVRQMLQDERAKPTERTKTEDEKAREEAKRLKKLEEKRMKRMRGEPTSDDEEPKQKKDVEKDEDEEDYDQDNDDAAEFGLGATAQPSSRPDGVDDEDDFLMDDDLVASDSEADMSGDESDSASEIDETMAMDDDMADFLKNVLPDDKPKQQAKAVNGVLTIGADSASSKLAFTYPCPRSHEELLEVFKNVEIKDIPTAIQRIRALYHSGLHSDNKNKLADFACALVDHVSYLSNQTPPASLAVIESMIRHIHSMSRSYPAQIATKLREHLKKFQESNDPTSGDLALLTAIGTIFPTSDHFHQVVTPAVTLMARWMGLTSPVSTNDVAKGAYVAAICLQYQRLSKRYIPELIRYTTLCIKSPHATPALLASHTKNIFTAADLWSTSVSFIEIFTPLIAPLKATSQKSALQTLTARLTTARHRRRPQLLHSHRALPIKTSIPKFEESFDPNKHYDPDKERAEAAKLQKEYKREKKGALRELRKDGNFIARESLREKKDKDKRYNEKYRRIVAEIQGEEGREKNVYEREKRKRQGGR